VNFLKNYKHYLIALILLLLIKFCVPAANGLTDLGVNILALMVPILYLWLTIGTDWVSLLALAGVAISGAMTPNAVYAGSLGNSTIMIIISCMVLNAVLAETGVIKHLASWFLTRNIVKGRPYVFMAMFLLGVTLIGLVMNVTTMCVTFIAFVVGICDEIGYKKGTPFYTALILGLFWMSNVTNGASPISHSLPLLMIGTAKGAGIEISYSQYLAIGLPFTAVMYVLAVVVICLIWKPNADLFKNYDVEAAKARREPLSKAGIIASVVFIIVVLTWIIPDLFPTLLPAPVQSALKTWGPTIPTIIGASFLCIVKVDNKPVGSFPKMIKSVPLSLLIFCGAVVVFGSIFNAEDAGISVALNNVLTPITSNLSPFILCAIAYFLCLVLTNFVSNTVAMILFFSICIPALAGTSVSTVAVTITLCIIANFASLVPSAAVTAPLFFGDGHITVKNALKWNLVMIGLAFLVSIFIVYPLGNLLL